MKGVRGRIDVFGDEVLPLREQDVRDAAVALLEEGVEGIVVSLLFSYRNPAHEQRVAEIIEQEKASARRQRRGARVPLLRAVPDAPRPAPPELDGDRGLRGRALAQRL